MGRHNCSFSYSQPLDLEKVMSDTRGLDLEIVVRFLLKELRAGLKG